MSDFVNNSPWNKHIQTITTVTVSSITNIGSNAFKNCSNLKSVTISKSIEQIQSNPFIGCTSLTSVKFELDIGFAKGEKNFREFSMFFGIVSTENFF